MLGKCALITDVCALNHIYEWFGQYRKRWRVATHVLYMKRFFFKVTPTPPLYEIILENYSRDGGHTQLSTH